ncbi:MAG: response regulator [Ignavibacteriaceae bacterium]|nr:response regulator [Ignavibacteriaceae bacterium]
MKILIIENDLANAAIIKRFLQGAYEMDVANDSNSAAALIRDNNYDGYIVDINLGEDTTGLDLLYTIKASERYVNQPIITVTAYATALDRTEFLSRGFTHYLAKPVEKYKLLETVNTAIEEAKKG